MKEELQKMLNQQNKNNNRTKAYILNIFLCTIALEFLSNTSTVLAGSCIAANCDVCQTNSSICQQCTQPFKVNNYGFCDSSNVCGLNQFYLKDTNNCSATCPQGSIQNSILNICEQANSCSMTNSIGNKYLPPEYNGNMFFDPTYQVYLQCSSTEFLNIYDSTNVQFQAQITTDMKSVNKQIYDSTTQNIIVTNTLGEVEIWNILSTNQVFKSKVTNYDNTNVFYFPGVQLFFYIDQQKYLNVIDDFSQPPKTLPYFLTNTDFSCTYVDNPKSVIFAGSQQELLHISIDKSFSLLFWNKYNTSIPTQALEMFRPTVFPNFVMFYRLKASPMDVVLYFGSTQKWIRSDQVLATQIGYFIDTIFQKNTTHVQFYSISDDGKLSPLGYGNPIPSSYIVPYDKNTKAFALTFSQTSTPSLQARLDLDISQSKKFTDGMFTNQSSFTMQISNFLLIDDVNRRLIIKTFDTNIIVLNIDSLKVVFSIKQLQQPPISATDLISMMETRIDTDKSSNLIALSSYSAQSINIYNHKKKFKSAVSTANFWNIVVTKDLLISTLQATSSVIVYKLSNMQRLVTFTVATAIDNINKCVNPMFSVSASSNDFITACKLKVVYNTFNSVTNTFTSLATYTLKNPVFSVKEMQNHLIICYIVECFYHLKTSTSTGTQFVNSLIGVMAINTRNDQNFFTILTSYNPANPANTNTVIFIDYSNFQIITTFNLPSVCYLVYASGYIEGNTAVFVCKPDAVSLTTTFFILKLITTPSPSVILNVIKLDRITTTMNFIDSKTIFSFYASGVKLYFYMYAFTSDFSSLIIKAQNVIPFTSVNPTPYYDTILRRIFFSQNSYSYSATKYTGEYQIWSYQYQNRYYDIIEPSNTNQILKYRKCYYNSYVIGIVRQGSILISDNLYKLDYPISVTDVTDIYIDSKLDTIFYLTNSNVLNCYNYVQGQIKYSYTSNSILMSDFSTFISPNFPNTFIISNRSTLDLILCQYSNIPADLKCYSYRITNPSIPDQTGILISTITCYSNTVFVYDSKQYQYKIVIDPTVSQNQIIMSFSISSSQSVMKVFPAVSLITLQVTNFRDGQITNLNGFSLSTLKQITQEIIDIIFIQNDYLMICPKIIYRLMKNFNLVYSISTSVLIKKVLYYEKKNIILIIAQQGSYSNYISFYDISTQLQLQSLQVGVNPLQDIIYLTEEDIFVVYTIFGQIFRIDLNKSEQEEYIVNQLEAETNSVTNNYIPIIYFNRIINKMFFANANTVYKWNYSPFIGDRLNFRRVRYIMFNSVQNLQNADVVYYSDVQNFVWEFNANKQNLVIQAPSDVQDIYSTNNYLIVFCYSNILVFQIQDFSNTQLNNISITTTSIQMSMKFNRQDQQIFAYITHDYEFYTLTLTSSPTASPVKIATLSAIPQDFILISDDIVIISLLNQPPVKFKLGDSSFTVLTGFPNLKTLMGCKLIENEQNYVLIEEKNIIKFNASTFAIVNTPLNFPELDSAGMIESHAFDDKLNLLYIHYLTENYVQVIPYSLNKADIIFIGSCDIYQVKFLILDEYVAIYCFFQINFHSRTSPKLPYLYSFRQPTIVKSMINLIILNNQYLIIIQTDSVMIFSMSSVDQGTRTFTLFKTFYSIRSSIFQCFMNDQNNIKISGVGYDGYFNNLIVMGNSCQNKFKDIRNKLNLKNQLNKVNVQSENIQKYYYFNIELDQSTSFQQLPFIDDLKFKNNNALIQYVPEISGQILTIYNDIFSTLQINDLVIEDFKFNFSSQTQNISFNPQTQTVIFKSISITQDLKNISFIFSNIKKVIIDKLVISDITIQNSILFQAKGITSFYFSNVSIINVKFINSQLINISDSNKIVFTTFELSSSKGYDYKNKMIINIKNSDSFMMNNFLLRDISGVDISTSNDISNANEVYERDNLYLTQQLNHLIYLQKIKNIQLSSGNCFSFSKISMIKIEDFFTDGNILQTLENSKISFSSINFKNNKAMDSVVFIKGSDISLNLISAIANQCSDCNGSVFFVYQSKKLDIQDSIFEQNYAIHGGSLANIDCIQNQNTGKNNTFSGNTARGNGGAIFIDNCDLDISQTNFNSNKALIGGAIRYKNLVPTFINNINDTQSSIKFQGNKGSIFGNNYGSYLGIVSLEKLDGSINQGSYNSTNQTFQTFSIDNFSSGDSINVKAKILDEELQLLKFNPQKIVLKNFTNSIRVELQKIILNLVSLDDNILIEGNNLATYSQFVEDQQLFVFSENRLISQPMKSGIIHIQTNVDFEIPDYFLNKLNDNKSITKGRRILEKIPQTINKNQFSISFNFGFRDCVVGEIYQNISDTKTACQKCPLGSYSIEKPDYFKKQECIQCSQSYIKECGNSTIVLQDGYWRLDDQSDVVVECINRKENCYDRSNSKYYCIKGLIGPLCEQCDILGEVWGEPYSQTSDFQCAPCTNHFDTYVRWVFIFIGVNVYIIGTLYIFFQIYRQKSMIYYLRLTGIISFGNSGRRDQSSTYLKFLINYAQLQSSINQFKYDIYVLSIPSMFGQPVSQLNTATDCQIVAYQNKLLVKTSAMLCLPILFYFWICIVYLFYSIFTKRPDGFWALSRMKLFTLFLFSFTVFQPNIVSFLIQSLSCRVIGTKKYVTSDITMECYNQEHILVIIIATIGIFLWVVVVPLLIFLKLKRIAYSEWITVQYCYGFLYLEFKQKHIYWELVRLYLKLFIVLFVNLLRQNPITQFVCLSMTLSAYFHMVHTNNPYETTHMNKIDKQIILSLSLQLILNAVIKDVDQFSYTYIIVMLIDVFINITTLSFLVCVILTQKINFIKQNIIKFKYKLLQIKCLSKLSFLQVSEEVDANFKRFQNWRFLSSNLQYAIAQCQRLKYQQLRENFVQRSENMKIGSHNYKNDPHQIKESTGFDMMFKELDSITVKRGNNSFVNSNKLAPTRRSQIEQQFSLDNQESSKNGMPNSHIKDSVSEDKSNMDIVNSIGRSGNSIPILNYNPIKANLLKISVNNSPLQSSLNSFNALQTHEKASPFSLQNNFPHVKSIIQNRNSIECSPQQDSYFVYNQGTSASSSFNIGSTAIFSHNLLNLNSMNQVPQTQKRLSNAKQFIIDSIGEIQDDHYLSSSSKNKINQQDVLQEREDEYEEKNKFAVVGLKSFNSQINPKVLNDEEISNQSPNHPRHKKSQTESSEENCKDEIISISKTEDYQHLEDHLRIQESPITSNLPSQLDRYSYPTDYLMKMSSKR